MCKFDVIIFLVGGGGGGVGSFVVGTCVYVYLSLSLCIRGFYNENVPLRQGRGPAQPLSETGHLRGKCFASLRLSM